MPNRLRARHITVITLLYPACFVPCTYGQTSGAITDVPVVTPGTLSSEVGFVSGTYGYGSISPTTTADGYTYYAFATAEIHGGQWVTGVGLTGFASDPGAAWLTSVSCNGVKLEGSSATHIWSSPGPSTVNNYAEWQWKTATEPAFFSPPKPVQCTVVHPGTSGWIRPKYQVIGLTYAPPGAKSTATYVSGFMSGTSTTNTSTFKAGVTEKATVTTGFDLFGVLSGDTIQTFSVGWSQEQDNTNSITVADANSIGLIVPGPASSGVGVDHDYDTIYIWLNPEVFLEILPNTVNFSGYGYDARDTITGPDVLPLTVGQLRGTQPITDPSTKTRLDRTWDTSLGALTSADFQDILHADPFVANPTFNPNTDTSGRYELPELGSPPKPVDLIMNYEPAPPGGQSTGQPYTSSYTSTSAAGQSAKDTYTVGYSIDGAAAFLSAVKLKLTSTQTYTYTNQWSKRRPPNFE